MLTAVTQREENVKVEKKTGATLADVIREQVTKEVTERVTLGILREDLRATLEVRFGSLSKERSQWIERCKDAVRLRTAFRQACRVKDNSMSADLVCLWEEVIREATDLVTDHTTARVTEQVTLRIARENLQALLEERFGPLPKELLQRIECCEDGGRLRSAFRQGLRLDKLDDLQL